MEAVSVNSDIFLDCDLKVDSLTDLYIFTWGLDTGKKTLPNIGYFIECFSTCNFLT